METTEKLEQLEQMVNMLLGKLNEFKTRNEELERSVSEKNSQVAELEARIDLMTADKNDIGSRVDSLLSAIEEWEKAEGPSPANPDHNENGSSDAREEEENADGATGGDLFSMGT